MARRLARIPRTRRGWLITVASRRLTDLLMAAAQMNTIEHADGDDGGTPVVRHLSRALPPLHFW